MMPFPTSAFEIAAIIALLLPGLVYAVVRRKRKGFGPDDLTIDTRIAQALLISVLLSSAYVALGWAWLDGLAIIDGETVTIVNPLGLGLTVLVACALVPAGLAWLLNLPYEIRRWREGDTGWKLLWRWKLERTIRASSIPTAWDAAASRPHHRMVRVQFPDGRWIGGFYGPGSRADHVTSGQFGALAQNEHRGSSAKSGPVILPTGTTAKGGAQQPPVQKG